ncbi:MAG: DUF2817 domain-containing protein [Phycisphaerae bacterium]|nr:DUF2817 domain-containing protein [Phycisphaerae bacterium]
MTAKKFWIVLSTSILLLMGGCYYSGGIDISDRKVVEVVQTLAVGTSVDGRAIECLVLGGGSDVVLLMSTIHGNENVGTPLLERMKVYLQNNSHFLQGRKVVIMPLVNPDGMANNARVNAHGIDLNRNFPADNRIDNKKNGFEALSEPESVAVYNVINRYKPGRIVTMHQPLNCIDYDGPGLALAQRLAGYCDLPVKKLGSRPGSLGSYAGNVLEIPIITVEFPRSDSNLSDQQIWQKYYKMTLAAIVYPDEL